VAEAELTFAFAEVKSEKLRARRRNLAGKALDVEVLHPSDGTLSARKGRGSARPVPPQS
jgi:hypothetical protein